MGVEDFPEERDGCYSEESCGMEEWRCRVSDDPFVVSLKWYYPFRKIIYSSIGMLCTFLFSVSAVVSFFKEQPKNDDDDRDEDTESTKQSIPFFRSQTIFGLCSRAESADSSVGAQKTIEAV